VIYVFLVALLIVVYLFVIYNNFVSLDERINASWSDIDVQLKRRYDLIPALVKTIKGYQGYEQSTLEKIIQARQAGINASDVKSQAEAENMLTRSLGTIFALAEAYPDLKANETFLKLQNELGTLEDAIQNARRYYNAVVRDYNAKCRSVPDVIIASKFHFEPREYFELEEKSAREMPNIDL